MSWTSLKPSSPPTPRPPATMIRASSIGQGRGGLLEPVDDRARAAARARPSGAAVSTLPGRPGLLGGDDVRADGHDPPLAVRERRGRHELAAEHAHLDRRPAVPGDRGRVHEDRPLQQRGERAGDVAAVRPGAGQDRGGRLGGENRRCPLGRDLRPGVAVGLRLGDRDDAADVARELLGGGLRDRPRRRSRPRRPSAASASVRASVATSRR